jgi:hypothetical protein
VVSSAVLVGLVAAIPVAALTLLVPLVLDELSAGATVTQALAAPWTTDPEDWEMIPLFLGAAVLLAALVATVAAVVWCLVAARAPGRPWVAQVAAALAAAAVPPLLFAWEGNWSIAGPAAAAAALIALLAAPRVGFVRERPRAALAGTSAGDRPT